MSDDRVRLDFPLRCLELHDDRATIVLKREHLADFAAFVQALQLGLIDIGMQPVGHG